MKIQKILAILLLVVLFVPQVVCFASAEGEPALGEAPEPKGGEEPTPEPTEPPATEPPATEPPATDPPATDPPATNPPATNPPATNPPATYTVRFMDNHSGTDVQIGSAQTVRAGEDAQEPDPSSPSFPTHVGYRFNGWSASSKNVQQNLTVYAKWKEVYCTVTFYDGYYATPQVISSVVVRYGDNVTSKPAAPAHPGYIHTSETVRTKDGDPASLTDVREDLSVTYKYASESEQTVALGRYTIQTVKPDSTVTLALPLILYAGSKTYNTNTAADSPELLSYMDGSAVRDPFEFSQALYTQAGITSLSLEFDTGDPGALPFTAQSISETAYAVETTPEGTLCYGYAAFVDLKLKGNKSLENTYYKLPLIARWTDEEGGEYEAELEAQIQVTGVKKSTGGGGGGGGGGTPPESTPNPQARLIIDGIRTKPETVNAGDTFDVILSLRNTSEKLYLQNLELSYTTDEDTLIPVSGSNVEYIPLIAANSTYEAVLRVKARPDISSENVRLNVSMSFEDKNLTDLSATQTMALTVNQVQKATLDEVILPTGTLTENSAYDIKMNVYNAGRTTLYNVTAQVVTENEKLTTNGRFFAGNMESGTSKVVEVEVTPLAEGEYTGELVVTYEDINGKVTESRSPFSIYASAEEDFTFDEGMEFVEPEPEPEPSPLDFLSRLNPWVYAVFGALVLYVALASGVHARNKRKRAFEEDEMD
ncbi:MAG: hypothetical protein ACOYI8_02880 [Christensenellales bacterium]|jgi:hypothetical protein